MHTHLITANIDTSDVARTNAHVQRQLAALDGELVQACLQR
jgi:hypothetical protein